MQFEALVLYEIAVVPNNSRQQRFVRPALVFYEITVVPNWNGRDDVVADHR